MNRVNELHILCVVLGRENFEQLKLKDFSPIEEKNVFEIKKAERLPMIDSSVLLEVSQKRHCCKGQKHFVPKCLGKVDTNLKNKLRLRRFLLF